MLFSALWTLEERQLHINVLRAQGSSPDPPASGAGSPQPNNLARARHHGHSVVYKQTRGSGLQDPQRQDVHAVPVVDSQINHGHGDTQARCQQRVGRFPVTQSPGPHRETYAVGESGAPAVPIVEHSPSGLVHEPPEPLPPPLVLSDCSPVGGALGPCPNHGQGRHSTPSLKYHCLKEHW